jgi:hypothetical protein
VKVTPAVLKAHQTYKDIAGKKLPGFSAIAGILNKPALIPWAWRMGKENIDLSKARQQAFDIGTAAHFLVECHINGWEPDLSDFSKNDIDRAENSFLKFLDFWKGYTLIRSEYQMASTRYGYGGTADITAQDEDGDVCLIDLKTSGGVYPEYKMQLCCYKRLWDEGDVEMVGGEPVERNAPAMTISRMVCVRIGKDEEGDVEAVDVPNKHYADYLRIFDAALTIWSTQKAVNWR